MEWTATGNRNCIIYTAQQGFIPILIAKIENCSLELSLLLLLLHKKVILLKKYMVCGSMTIINLLIQLALRWRQNYQNTLKFREREKNPPVKIFKQKIKKFRLEFYKKKIFHTNMLHLHLSSFFLFLNFIYLHFFLTLLVLSIITNAASVVCLLSKSILNLCYIGQTVYFSETTPTPTTPLNKRKEKKWRK